MKITIIEAMQNQENDLRLSSGNRWMVGDGNGWWTVYERLPYAHTTSIVINTNKEEIAIAYLLKSSEMV